MNRQWRRCALVVLGFLVGGGRTARADADAVLSSQLTECIEAAAGVRGVDPEMATKLFARTCSAACPGLPAYAATEPGQDWRPLGDQCQLFCSPNARAAFEAAPPARRWAVLADSCGTDYYGLPAGQGALLSDVWFVLQRIGVWLQHAKPAAGPKSRLALADLAKTLPLDRFVLPLPGVLPHRFHLPEATHAFDDIRSRDYLVIGAEQVSFGTRPEAKLTVDGARLDTVFPGDPIALADLPARHVPFRVPAAKIPVGGARGVLSPPPSAADKTLAVVRRNAPLLFADRALPAARVAQVLKTLGPDGGYLGVTDGQGHAGAHTVVLTEQPLEMPVPTTILSLGGQPIRASALHPSSPAVWLDVRNATVGDLVDAMNVLSDAGVRLMILSSTAPAGTEPVAATATLRGSLDKDDIRAVIRRNLDQVKNCYEAGLARAPTLSGRIIVKFVISATGAVTAAETQDTTVHDSSVEQCVNVAVRTWSFPKPTGGGTVTVSYPFVLKREADPPKKVGPR